MSQRVSIYYTAADLHCNKMYRGLSQYRQELQADCKEPFPNEPGGAASSAESNENCRHCVLWMWLVRSNNGTISGKRCCC